MRNVVIGKFLYRIPLVILRVVNDDPFGKAGDIMNDYGYEPDPDHGLQFIGLAFITLAVLGLLGALVQEMRIAKRLADAGFGRVEPTPLGQVMGILVLLVGIFGAIVIFL